jgi:hypothetical protein
MGLVVYKRPKGACLPFPLCEVQSMEQTTRLHKESANILILEFQVSRIMRNKFLLFINYQVLGILLEQPNYENKGPTPTI